MKQSLVYQATPVVSLGDGLIVIWKYKIYVMHVISWCWGANRWCLISRSYFHSTNEAVDAVVVVVVVVACCLLLVASCCCRCCCCCCCWCYCRWVTRLIDGGALLFHTYLICGVGLLEFFYSILYLACSLVLVSAGDPKRLSSLTSIIYIIVFPLLCC